MQKQKEKKKKRRKEKKKKKIKKIEKEVNLLLNQCRQGKVVKEVCEVLPDVCVAVFPQALIIKPVDLGDLTTLVVTLWR